MRLAFLAWLCWASLGRAALPPAAQELLPRLAPARAALQQSRYEMASALERSKPAQARVAELKRQDSWWSRFWLRSALADLKERLDAVQAAEAGVKAAQSALFLILTGLEEETTAALDKLLSGPRLDKALAGQWRGELRAWAGELNELGREAGEGALTQAPPADESAGKIYWQGRLAALEARQVQLEALAAQGERNASLDRRLARAGALSPGLASQDERRNEMLRREWLALIEENVRALSQARLHTR